MSDDLKPCPFCGGPADHPREDMMPPRKHMAECARCPVDNVATEDWNRRPIEARLRAELDAAREAIRSLHKLLPSSFAKDALNLPAVRDAVGGER